MTRKMESPCSRNANVATIFGWLRLADNRASRMNHSRVPASENASGLNCLIATGRSRFVSSAR